MDCEILTFERGTLPLPVWILFSSGRAGGRPLDAAHLIASVWSVIRVEGGQRLEATLSVILVRTSEPTRKLATNDSLVAHSALLYRLGLRSVPVMRERI